MAVLEGGTSAALAGVGVESGSPLHIVAKPISVGSAGHFHTSHRCAIVASQAANSRLFEIRNADASLLCVVTRLRIQWFQTAAHTAAIEDSLDVYKCTSFSAVDTTNTVTPVITKMRTSFGSATSVVRGVTVAGASAGMTGGTLTKDTAAFTQTPLWLLAAAPTGGPVPAVTMDYAWDSGDGESPFVFAQNEGLIVENRVSLGIAAGSAVYIDISWAETTAY